MRQLGKIQCLEIFNDENAPWIILFHGYGADAYDLQSLAEYIPLKKNCNWLFPQGILEVPIGPGWTGRAWWQLDMMKIQNDIAKGIERDTSTEIPAGLGKARQMGLEMISQLKVPWNKIILGGFSQGGMIAADLCMQAPENPLGLVILSSACINKDEWKNLAPKRAGLPFFQSHGEGDQVLQIKNGQRMEGLFTTAGMKGSLMKFRGGHEIPPGVIQKMAEYLNSRLETI